jgi:hypothetical protein
MGFWRDISHLISLKPGKIKKIGGSRQRFLFVPPKNQKSG